LPPVDEARRERSIVSGVRESARASWWITFVLLAALGGAWALASPPTGVPDERDHAINAAAVARGQLVGDALTPAQKAALGPGRGNKRAYRSVDVPEIYADANTQCFAFAENATANCFHFDGSDRIVKVITPVTWYPPAFYAFVGTVARPFDPGPDALYVMRFASAVLMAALLASGVASLRRVDAPRVRMLAFLTALTPMTLFLGASVNPSGVEIVAGLAVWASGVVLVREATNASTVDGRVALRFVLAAAILALTRQDAPFWLLLVLVTLSIVAGVAGLRVLWQSRTLRFGAIAVGVCTLATAIWVFAVGTFSSEHNVFLPRNLSDSATLRQSIGRSFTWYREMIGWFGWLDAPSPALTVVLWTLVLGGLVVLAVALGQPRWAMAAVAVVVATFALPIVLEFIQSQGVGAGHWQGRYALPFATGAPLLAAVSLERDDIARRVAASALPLLVAIALFVAQVGAIYQNLRRYAVGYDGTVWFFSDAPWSPPLGSLAILVIFAVAFALLAWWLLTLRPVPTSVSTPDQAPAAPLVATP
jgi:hypothetical protein